MSHNNETKWFMQLNIIEFMKSLTNYREIDSLDIFYEKSNEFLGNDNAPSDPVLPENTALLKPPRGICTRKDAVQA